MIIYWRKRAIPSADLRCISGKFKSAGLATVWLIIAAGRLLAGAQEAVIKPKQGAELLKTDIMGVFAHPDDETGVSATLAWYAMARKAVVANVYCTRGEGGGNMVGTQGASALGILRGPELLEVLAQLGGNSH